MKEYESKISFSEWNLAKPKDKGNRNLVDKTISSFFMSVYEWNNLYPMSIIDFTSIK